MKEQLISSITAKLAKEKGFEFHCICNEKDPFDCKCDGRVPQSLLQKWLREKHNIHIEIKKSNNIKNGFWVEVDIWDEVHCIESLASVNFNTYEEALEVGLCEALKLIK